MYYFTITEIHNFKTAIKAPAEIINGGRSTYWALIFNWAWQPRLAFSFQAGLYGLRIPDSRVRLPSVFVIIQTISQLWSCGAAKRAALNAQFNAWLVLAPNARGSKWSVGLVVLLDLVDVVVPGYICHMLISRHNNKNVWAAWQAAVIIKCAK